MTDPTTRPVRLTVALAAGPSADTIALEPAHLERFFRTAAYVAIREGRLGSTEPALGRLVAGEVRDRHGDVLCLDGFGVELLDAAGCLRAHVRFRGRALEAFALRRAVHRLGEAGEQGRHAVRYALHAVPDDGAAFPVALPRLRACSLDELTAGAAPSGEPDGEWIATVIAAEAARGLVALAEASRAAGVEAAGRIAAQVGYDPAHRCFVRVLDRLVVARGTRADAVSVVSTAGSWRDFLDTAPADGPLAITSVHTHLHLTDGRGGDGEPGEHLLADGGLSSTGAPCISIDDLVTHYVAFPEPLSASAIVSVFPDRRETRLYGYTPGAELRLEPGYWLRSA